MAQGYSQSKYGLDFNYSNNWHFDNYYDKDSLYYKKPEDYKEYEAIMKEKVLSDIKNNPYWYLSILTKRAVRILNNTIPFSYIGWFSIILAFVLFRFKYFDYLILLFVSVPLSFTPFFIYSGHNATYNSLFPIMTLAIIVTIFIEYWHKKKANK